MEVINCLFIFERRRVANVLGSHVETCTVSISRSRADNWDSRDSSGSGHEEGGDKGLHGEYRSGWKGGGVLKGEER